MGREPKLAESRKKALDNLFRAGKISQLTYEYLTKEITDAIEEAEGRQRKTANRITSGTGEPPFGRVTPASVSSSILVETSVENLMEEQGVKELIGTPRIAAEKPTKGATIETAKGKRKRGGKRKGRLKRKRAKRALAKRVKKAATPRKPHPRGISRIRCRNPWNGRCKNTDIEVSIYYKDEFLPICQTCWDEIADQDIAW